MIDLTTEKIPPGQQLIAADKWPTIGEKKPSHTDEPWTLQLGGLVNQESSFVVDELRAFPQTTLRMDIHCVTRWSKQKVEFRGVLLSDLLEHIGLKQDANFLSFVARSERKHSTSLPIKVACELPSLIAIEVNGKPLGIDHGGPIRNIVPGRYFYKSVKWLEQIEVLAEDRLGFWEAETGYHNNADPWLEERYMAPTIDRRTAIKLIESRDFSDKDLRSIDASKRDLTGLKAIKSLLRDANFRKSNLAKADFTDANMSNSHLQESDLRGAILLRTDLEGSNLSGADLREANLTGCFLTGASFFEERPDGSVLAAMIDNSTILPDAMLAPLTEPQLDFVRKRLSSE